MDAMWGNPEDSRFLVVLGAGASVVLVVGLALKILEGIRLFLLSPKLPLNLKKYGRWAVVTGATDGIGKAYATELAKRGMNVVLISRTMQKLEKTAEELQQFGVSTDVIQADFSKGWEIFPHIREKLKGKNVGILVNNVGTLLHHPCSYLKIENSGFMQLINMNMLSVIIMYSIVLPSMLKEKKGCVINISSISGLRPLSLKSSYSASKAFVVSLSQALSYELGEIGIESQCLVPSYVSTKLVKFSDYLQKESIFVPSAETYAASAIHTLTRCSISTGYWFHSLQLVITDALPWFLWNLSSRLVQRGLDSRKRIKSIQSPLPSPCDHHPHFT